MTYANSGVKYNLLDPFKVLAQREAKKTANANEVIASRGESAYVWEEEDAYRAMVVEGLGTKSLVADAVRKVTGKTYYQAIAQDTVAMIVNDLIVVGAKPQVVNAYFAVGSSEWFEDKQRASDLATGFAKACKLAGATWGGGETPALAGIIEKDTIDLAGSALGMIKPKNRLVLGDKLQAGDSIVLIESSGIHANGLTLARKIADRVGYDTMLGDGQMYGEALLRPTHIYAQLVNDLFTHDIDIHYMVNITGHGWRKLMRANKDFTYVLKTLPSPAPLFNFIQEQSGNSDEEMYGNFNMGAGFCIYVPKKQADKVVDIATENNLHAWVAGEVTQGKKAVEIVPKNIVFEGESLRVR